MWTESVHVVFFVFFRQISAGGAKVAARRATGVS